MAVHQVAEVRAAHDAVRATVWPALREVAVPDPVWGFDFDNVIADFAGSAATAGLLRALPGYQRAATVFATPDGSTTAVREAVLEDGKTLLMTTYGIADGFRRVAPEDVPDGGPRQGASIEWLTRSGPRVALAELEGAGIEVLVTGAGAMTPAGVRLGKGHGYFDLEWAMLTEVGALAPAPLVVGIVHDCQVVDLDVAAADHDVPVDVLLTGTSATTCPQPPRAPGRVDWALLSDARAASMPPLVELALRQVRGWSAPAPAHA